MTQVFNIDEEGRFGGPERRISLVATGLRELGVSVTVVIPKLDNVYFKRYLSERDIDFLVLDITRLSLEPKILIRYILRFSWEVFLLFRLLVKHKPDVVHVNSASQFKVAIAAKLAGRRVVWHLNNTFLMRPVKRVFEFISRFCLDGVIYAGSRAGVFYRVKERFNALPTANIEAPVSEDFFNIPIKHTLGEPLEIVSVGGVNSAKGITDLVLCASECHKRQISFRIRVAGKILASQKDYFEEVQRLIDTHYVPGDVLEFLGEVEDIPSLLEDADIALTLSRREASPTAVWEGLAAARIVLTTNVGSVIDHIDHGKNGFVVAVQGYEEAADIIERISHRKINLDSMREAARETAERCFKVQAIAEQHKKIYGQIISAE